MARESGEISENTRITLGAVAAVILVLVPLVAWAVRVEMNTSSKVSKEQYIQDMADVKADLKAIKQHFRIKDPQ